jgi:hypothetical protein
MIILSASSAKESFVSLLMLFTVKTQTVDLSILYTLLVVPPIFHIVRDETCSIIVIILLFFLGS